MMPLIENNWPLLLGVLAVALLLAAWLIAARRRTKVSFAPRADDGQPALRNQALIDAAPVAAAADAPTAAAPEGDIARLKGVGPKLIAQLAELGVTRLAQIAAWDGADIARIDGQLGRFAGRIERDDWVGQARLLENGDTAGFEERFGKM